MIAVKRIYDPPSLEDGGRVLVDRLWPRGVSREAANLYEWRKEVAPSDDLRRWYDHDPLKWEEFKRRYFSELDEKAETWESLVDLAQSGTLTLLYSSRERELNNAEALKIYLESKLQD